MPLGQTADQLERAVSIEAEAAVFAEHLRVPRPNGFRDRVRVALLFRAVGIKEENGLALRQLFRCIF